MHKFHITLVGEGFDAQEFHHKFSSALPGEVFARKKIVGGSVSILGYGWRSEKIEFELEASCSSITSLLENVEKTLAALKPLRPTVWGQLVLGYQYGSVQGYGFDAACLKRLASVCDNLDVSVELA